jgi:hypothetical protein
MKTIPEAGYGLIYLLTFGNGKHYVGLTEVPFDKRLSVHQTLSKYKRNKLYNGWRKHGLVSAEVIDDTCRAGAELREAETRYIKQYDSYRNGYNSTTGGETNPMSFKEGRENHLAAVGKLPTDPAWKEAHLKGIRKLHADPVYKEKLAEAIAKRNAKPVWQAENLERINKLNADPKFKAANNKRLEERWANPAYRLAQSERMKKRHTDPVYRAALYGGLRKKHSDPAWKAAQSERSKKATSDPVWKARQSEIAKRLNADPEFRAAQAAAMAKMWADPDYRHNQAMVLQIRIANRQCLPYTIWNAKLILADQAAIEAQYGALWAAEDAAMEQAERLAANDAQARQSA